MELGTFSGFFKSKKNVYGRIHSEGVIKIKCDGIVKGGLRSAAGWKVTGDLRGKRVKARALIFNQFKNKKGVLWKGKPFWQAFFAVFWTWLFLYMTAIFIIHGGGDKWLPAEKPYNPWANIRWWYWLRPICNKRRKTLIGPKLQFKKKKRKNLTLWWVIGESNI